MKKIYDVFMAAAMMCAAVCMSSCGGNGGGIVDPEEPEEKVEMGYYDLHFEKIYVDQWPDAGTGVEEAYEAYQKTVKDALKLDLGKEYKWSEIEADKAKVQKAFDELGDFEYKVKSALNIITYHGGITLKAYKDSDKSYAAIDFGKKEITCIKDIPDGNTSQLIFEMVSYGAAAPSAKEYCEKVSKLFIDALVDVFEGGFEEVVTKGSVEVHTFYNLANYPGDRDEVIAQVSEICGAVEVPALSDELMAKALEEFPKMNYLMRISLTSYDPFVYAPSKSDKKVFDLMIGRK